MATLVQDVWLAGEARLRGRRYGPFEPPPARVVFQPDLGATLDDPIVSSFLETLGGRLEVFAFEPRGQGGSAGRPGPEWVADLGRLLDGADQRWPDRLPIVLAGHGLGASIALSLPGHPRVGACAALSPSLPPEPLIGSLDLPRRVAGLAVPLLLFETRGDPGGRPGALPDRDFDFVRAQPGAALV